MRIAIRAGIAALFAAAFSQTAIAQIYIQSIFTQAPIYQKAHLQDGINTADPKTGKTPLMRAIESQDMAGIFYIIQQGADLDMRDHDGETAMDIAARLHLADIQRILQLQIALHPGPAVFYAGKNPTVRIRSGQFQTALPGDAFNEPLMVQVTEGDRPLGNAPVTFTVGGDGGGLLTSALSPVDQMLILRTDQNGICGLFFVAPNRPQFRSLVEARVGTSGNFRKVVFAAGPYESNNPFRSRSPFQATNIIDGGGNSGDASLTWENRSPNVTCIIVERKYEDGTIKVLRVLAAKSTSVLIPGAWQ